MRSTNDLKHLPEFIEKMESEGLPELAIDTFSDYYHQIITDETGLLSEQEIQPVNPSDVADATHFDRYLR